MRQRRAYVCTHKDHDVPERRFIGADDPIPMCPRQGHGRMKPQKNVPYVPPTGELKTIGKRIEPPKRKGSRAK
jgi:hypothetical protein